MLNTEILTCATAGLRPTRSSRPAASLRGGYADVPEQRHGGRHCMLSFPRLVPLQRHRRRWRGRGRERRLLHESTTSATHARTHPDAEPWAKEVAEAAPWSLTPPRAGASWAAPAVMSEACTVQQTMYATETLPPLVPSEACEAASGTGLCAQHLQMNHGCTLQACPALLAGERPRFWHEAVCMR